MKHHLGILFEEVMAAAAFACVATLVCIAAIFLGGDE